jgi:hypothetical protein
VLVGASTAWIWIWIWVLLGVVERMPTCTYMYMYMYNEYVQRVCNASNYYVCSYVCPLTNQLDIKPPLLAALHGHPHDTCPTLPYPSHRTT